MRCFVLMKTTKLGMWSLKSHLKIVDRSSYSKLKNMIKKLDVDTIEVSDKTVNIV